MSEGDRNGLKRREFLAVTALGGSATAVGILGGRFLIERLTGVPEDVRTQTADPRSWVMVIDLDRCDGCGICTTACRNEHNVPDGQEWIKVYEVSEPDGASYFLPRPCMNCENAPCVAVCPVGATFVRTDGVVLIDHNRCIGCRYCMAACPYNARYFNWDGPAELTPGELAIYSPANPVVHRRGTVEKCMFCAHRADEGELPACVQACPMKAIFFGDAREDAVSNGSEVWRLSEALRERGGFRFKEELGTKPRVFYLPKEA
ncbi:MAG TPA: 4Fe-4S dicluster domain-containing protein [Thermoplasmata archaeon]|nr:4Fe-4S dicluster domain-containing protein [Thermoplasmata archaeon]